MNKVSGNIARTSEGRVRNAGMVLTSSVSSGCSLLGCRYQKAQVEHPQEGLLTYASAEIPIKASINWQVWKMNLQMTPASISESSDQLPLQQALLRLHVCEESKYQ